ncbi:uncharacterized protein LOC109806232 [Cajanus cajan]|uniref:uncharacterized protein LOC109806232 n=1 Tax=Cajanus cajan TaxID=3821 RepID=UPI00098D80B8|nr:uncharacterized protein LOC109806232 [Cajanus cajan]
MSKLDSIGLRKLECSLGRRGIDSVVRSAWMKQVQGSWAAQRLRGKLLNVKIALKKWNIEVFGNVDTKIKKGSQRRNQIIALKMGERMVEEVYEIKENAMLVGDFTEEEVWCLIRESDGDKSPGLDGFNFAFLKRFWPLMKRDVMDLLVEFHTNLKVLKALLSYFVALVPKVSCPQVAAEAIDYAQKYKKSIFVMKIDYEKAYDSVEWDYLLFMLRGCGFDERWVRWMEGCVYGGTLSALVNGSPTAEVGQLPFKHLGLPLGANPRKLSTWKPILDGLRKRLSSWKHRHLSIGRRVTLINSVLNVMPIHFLSFYKAPNSVIKENVAIQRDFLWRGVKDGSKIPWVKWEMVCKSKVEGGLGIKDVRLFNWALLGKWVWKNMLSLGMLWAKVLHSRYERIESFSNCSDVDRRASWWWKDIVCVL